jgi:hypothetical protein
LYGAFGEAAGAVFHRGLSLGEGSVHVGVADAEGGGDDPGDEVRCRVASACGCGDPAVGAFVQDGGDVLSITQCAALDEFRERCFTRESGHEIYPDTPSNLMTKLIRQHNDPVIPVSRGRPRKVLPRAAIQLPAARLHDQRHLQAITLLLAGEPVHVVAHRLGHSDPAITLRVYAHVIHRQAGSAEVFARAIDGDLDGVSTRPATSKNPSKTGDHVG